MTSSYAQGPGPGPEARPGLLYGHGVVGVLAVPDGAVDAPSAQCSRGGRPTIPNPISPHGTGPGPAGPDPFAGARTFRVALSRAGRVERIAERIVLAWGFRASDAAGLDFADAPWWRDVAETRARIAVGIARARDGEPLHGTVRIVTARGESRGLALTIDPIGEHEKVDFLLVNGVDVTAQHDADERLRRRAHDLAVQEDG